MMRLGLASKSLISLVLCLCFVSVVKGEGVATSELDPNQSIKIQEGREFAKAYMEKIVAKDYASAYLSLEPLPISMPSFSLQQFNEFFEETIVKIYGELKGVKYAAAIYEGYFTSVYYKADMDIPNMYIKMTLHKSDGEIKVTHIRFICADASLRGSWF